MKIGLVLSKTPSYSETFFNSKIKGLMSSGNEVVLFVQHKNIDFKLCRVVVATNLPNKPLSQLLRSLLVLISLLPHLQTVVKFVSMEKRTKRSPRQILKNLITNAHILKHRLNWLHFGFSTMAVNSEHVAKSIGAKMAVSCRGYDMDVYPLKFENPYALVWKNTDKVHAISNYMLLQAYKNGMDKGTAFDIITPAVDHSNLNTNTSTSTSIEEPVQILTIARLHWIKGLDYTLEALAKLKDMGIAFHYKIIGDGKEYESLRFAVHQLNLENCVTFKGQLSHEETLEELENTDLYLQYSVSEGFCNAVLEAQALGCLCIVSDGGALSENIIDNETGWVVPKRQPKLLAEQIFKVLNMSSAQHQTINSKAKERVLNQFTIEKQKEQFLKFYQ